MSFSEWRMVRFNRYRKNRYVVATVAEGAKNSDIGTAVAQSMDYQMISIASTPEEEEANPLRKNTDNDIT